MDGAEDKIEEEGSKVRDLNSHVESDKSDPERLIGEVPSDGDGETVDLLLNPEGECLPDPETGVRFDDILQDIGEFGTYQKIIYFLIFLPTIFRYLRYIFIIL